MKPPKVSILMPVYGCAAFVKEAVDSMLNQSYADFELILLDDCSPDNVAKILDGYDDVRIVRYRGEKNVGLANVLNTGMDMARGEYIARMDGDDVSELDRLELQVNYLDNHPEIDLCSCAMQLFGAKEDVWIRDSEPEAVKLTALFYSPILHASSVWRRERFDKAGLRFIQSMVPAEDYDMWTRALAVGMKMVNLPDVLYKYRIHSNQATGNRTTTMQREMEVRQSYLNMVLPSLSVDDITSFVCVTRKVEGCNVVSLQRSIKAIIQANNKDSFFVASKLENKLKRYYQAVLMKQDVLSIKQWCTLSWKRKIIRLFRK